MNLKSTILYVCNTSLLVLPIQGNQPCSLFQYAMFKKMQRGAVVIQHKYRAHREKEKQKSQAASVIQSYYRRYKERKSVPNVGALSESMAPPILDQAGSSLQMNRPSTLPEWRKNRVGQNQPK